MDGDRSDQPHANDASPDVSPVIVGKVLDCHTNMDVILDSNVFLKDLNLQGTQFAELFAYLKRTGDTLVLPTMVMQEASARYRERLTNALNTAKGAWGSLSGIRVSAHPAFPRIDLEKEVEEYRNRIIRAFPGVRVLQYSDVSGVDANEIARRGSQRIRPANQNGEELRDVLLWLLVLQYARQMKRDVAFISGDKGFHESKEQDRLHPSLVTEIAESKLPIHFFADIAAFVTSQSLSHQKIDAAWAQKYFQTEDFEHRMVMEIYKAKTKYGVPELVAIDRPEFVEGIAYQIAPESVYAELKYKGRTQITFDESQTQYLVWFVSDVLSDSVNALQVRDFLAAPRSVPLHEFAVDSTTRSGLDEVTKIAKTGQRTKIEKPFNFEALLSLRIEKEKLVTWQVDDIRLVETSD